MPKIKPEGDAGTKTVMVTVEPGLSKEQIEQSVKALPEIKEEGPDYNVVEALREVTLNASITEAEEENENKREETKMAAEEKKTNNEAEITDEMKEVAEKIARKNIKELMKLEEETKDEKSFITRVKENWDVALAVAALIVAIYFAWKNFVSSNDSMAQESMMSGLELALSDD